MSSKKKNSQKKVVQKEVQKKVQEDKTEKNRNEIKEESVEEAKEVSEKAVEKAVKKTEEAEETAAEEAVKEVEAAEETVKEVEATKPSTFNEEPEKEEPKTVGQRFLSKFNIFGDLFVLNVCFFFTCIPLFTIGASLTALYTVTNKMVRNEEGPIAQSYFKAFKSNFRQATAIWFIDFLCVLFIAFQMGYYQTHEGGFSKFLFVFMGMEFVIMAFAFPLQFPLLARYENTTGRIMLNSLLLALNNLSVWFRMFFIWLFPFALYYMKPNWIMYSWFLWGMVLTALLAYACSMFLRTFFDKIEAEEDEKAESE